MWLGLVKSMLDPLGLFNVLNANLTRACRIIVPEQDLPASHKKSWTP